MMMYCDTNYEIAIQCENSFRQFKCPKSGLLYIAKHLINGSNSFTIASDNKLVFSCGAEVCFKSGRLLRAVVDCLKRRV